jgi:hypothetical protein
MSERNRDIMAWMQKAYIDAHPAPWYRKIIMRIKLFVERHKQITGTPGAAMLDSLDELDRLKSKNALLRDKVAFPSRGQARNDFWIAPQGNKPERNRASIARMWDSL